MIVCVQHPHKLPSIYWGYLANIYCRQIMRRRSGKTDGVTRRWHWVRLSPLIDICEIIKKVAGRTQPKCEKAGSVVMLVPPSCIGRYKYMRGIPISIPIPKRPAQQLNLLRFWMELVPSGSQMGRRVMKNYRGHFVRLSPPLLRYSNFWSVKNIRLYIEIHTDICGTYTWICKQIMAAFGLRSFHRVESTWLELSWVGQNKKRTKEIDNSLAQNFVAAKQKT